MAEPAQEQLADMPDAVTEIKLSGSDSWDDFPEDLDVSDEIVLTVKGHVSQIGREETTKRNKRPFLKVKVESITRKK